MSLPIVQPEAVSRAAPAEPKLPTVAAYEALVAKVHARARFLPRHLWAELKLRWTMSLRLLDPKAVRVVTPHGKINDCSSCSDSCCIGPRSTVLLRLRDVAMLHDLGRTQLMTHTKPQFSHEALQRRPALRRQLGSAAWRQMPVLKQNAFGACVALDTEGRCTLFPHWPMSCARFPLSLDVETQEIFYAGRCRSFWIHPDEAPVAAKMAEAAVAAYNARIEDALVMTFARRELAELGLTRYLRA